MADVNLLTEFEALKRAQRPHAAAAPTEPEEPTFITDQAELVRLLEDELRAATVDADTIRRCASFRTEIKRNSWPVSTVLDNVDEDIWRSIVRAAIRGQREGIEHRQPNGRWAPREWQHTVKTINGDAHLVLVIRWLDTKGEQDLRYVDGRPAANVDVTVQNTLPPDVLDALKGGGANQQLLAALARKMEAEAAEAEARTAALKRRGADVTPPDQTQSVAADEVEAAPKRPHRRMTPEAKERQRQALARGRETQASKRESILPPDMQQEG